jgi:hypothetical protein
MARTGRSLPVHLLHSTTPTTLTTLTQLGFITALRRSISPEISWPRLDPPNTTLTEHNHARP